MIDSFANLMQMVVTCDWDPVVANDKVLFIVWYRLMTSMRDISDFLVV